jgi:hypothetical protein
MLEPNFVVKLRALAPLSASRAKINKGTQGCDLPESFQRKHNFSRHLLLIFKTYNMDVDDEDSPPLLVEVEPSSNDNLEESKPLKVPITIVTGKSSSPH